MKLSEFLGEMPYLYSGEMPRKELHSDISISALRREYTAMGRIGTLPVYIDSHQSHVVVVDLTAEVRNGRVPCILRLEFKGTHLIKFPHSFTKVVQVDREEVIPQRANNEIASSVYKMLVDVGYTLVSDIIQFEPAQALWKKIASDHTYTMYIADLEQGILPDVNGNDFIYTGDNIDDNRIWSQAGDFSGYEIVLVLTK